MSAIIDSLARAKSIQTSAQPTLTPTFSSTQTNSPKVVPPVPRSVADLGIPPAILEHLALKYLYFRGEVVGRELGKLMGLSFSLIDELLESLKRQHFVGVKKSLGIGNSSGVFALTEAGRNLAREYLENNQYAGPAPVPLYQYSEIVRRQRLRANWLSPVTLRSAYRHLVVQEDLFPCQKNHCFRKSVRP